ncbi:MAG: T9SS type A sorting domain-containing protein [Saprospiraceae bacterium]|nr:T9SS type A sorting domain-containing protein [Saprospiraceae bacterium]
MKTKVILLLFLVFISSFIYSQNESEPNNSFNEANSITLGNNLKASINPSNDLDYFKIQISQPGLLSVTVSNVPSNIGMRYSFYNAAQQQLVSSEYSNGQSFTEFHQICTPGTYYIWLTDSVANAAQYNLLATLDVSDVYECNEVLDDAKLIQLNTNVKASINPINDFDCFKIEMTQTGVLSVTVSNVPSNIGMKYRFLKTSPVHYKSGFYSKGQSFTESHHICTPGTYYIWLTDSVANAAQYNLLATLDVSDVYECNGGFNDAKLILCNDSILASIIPSNDLDFFKCEITQPGVLSVTVSDVPSNIGMRYRFYNSDRQQLVSNEYSNGKSFTELHQIDTPGIYFIRLTDNDANSAQYKLKISCPSVVSVDDEILKGMLRIYPNPTNEKVNIEVDNDVLGSVNFKLFNAIGQKISGGILHKGINSLNLSQNVKGMYYLQIINEGKIATMKIVKE